MKYSYPKTRILSIALSVAASMIAATASACIWDSDTLAHEAKDIPEVIQVITGRFERNPPLYYEMRLKRVAAEIVVHPEKLYLYCMIQKITSMTLTNN